MSSIIPKTEMFRQEQARARQECQTCYKIVSELTKAQYTLLQQFEELVKVIETKLADFETDNEVMELTEDMEVTPDGARH